MAEPDKGIAVTTDDDGERQIEVTYPPLESVK